jgi:hypothetical protein
MRRNLGAVGTPNRCFGVWISGNVCTFAAHETRFHLSFPHAPTGGFHHRISCLLVAQKNIGVQQPSADKVLATNLFFMRMGERRRSSLLGERP